MALIEATAAAKAGPARVSVAGETGRLSALWSEEAAAIVQLWPVGFATSVRFESTTAWTSAIALGGTLEWPRFEYARTAGGWLIRVEQSPGEHGYDFIADEG